MASHAEKVGITAHLGQVSPVFDAAEQLEVFDVSSEQAVPTGPLSLSQLAAQQRATLVREHGIGTLICGAISGYAHDLLAAGGVRVIPWICGPVDGVLDAYLTGALEEPSWLMPGCRGGGSGRGRGMRRRGRWNCGPAAGGRRGGFR